jgi:hypothetical protein
MGGEEDGEGVKIDLPIRICANLQMSPANARCQFILSSKFLSLQTASQFIVSLNASNGLKQNLFFTTEFYNKAYFYYLK